MILAATFLLPFAMLGLVLALAWIEERYLKLDEGGVESWRAGGGGITGPVRIRAERRVVRRRSGRYRTHAGVVAGHHPPGRRVDPRRA